MLSKLPSLILSLSLLTMALTVNVAAQEARKTTPPAQTGQGGLLTRQAAALQELVNEAAKTALTKFADKKFTEENLAITLVDLSDPAHPVHASFRGDERIYPASVVKLFYLVAAHRWLEDGKLKESDELQRAMRDMIVDSLNEATHYVVDAVTETTSGPELPPAQMQEWANKRNVVNRYFAAQGYTNINTNQKPWCEGPYGRERAFVGQKYENRNKLTTNATARIMTEIVTGRAVTAARSAKMMELLKRDFAGKSEDTDDQAHGFTGLALGPGARLWSKAGWTSTTRHDAAYIELPNGARFILVTFTTDHANEREIIPTVARIVIAGMEKSKAQQARAVGGK
ncbi:MAG TPA: serine hydrolase [Pyrinomonadaceae bacterium]|jgi:beta-lactamase class A|nr:serine hydrolase [Pyrinomonadaceae bacterium]